MMRRSKLEVCINILETLAIKGPLKPTHIMQKANLNFNILKDCLLFLGKQGLVEEENAGRGRVVYGIAPRGVKILQYFRVVSETLTQENDKIKGAFEIKYLNTNDVPERYRQGAKRGF